MKRISTFGARALMTLALLVMTAVSAMAVNVTYQLTTHVDGRTLTGTGSPASVAELTGAMPASMKRAYCEYSFYTDAALTQPVSTLTEGATVYVDYVFNPPFEVSTSTLEVYYFMGSRNGTTNVWFKGVAGLDSGTACDVEYLNNGVNPPSASDINSGYYHLAFFGDSYAMQIKTYRTKQYLVNSGSGNTQKVIRSKTPQNWQMYENSRVIEYETGGVTVQASTFSLTPEENYDMWNYFIYNSSNNNPGLLIQASQRHLFGSDENCWEGAVVAHGNNNNVAWFLTFAMYDITGKDMYKYVIYTVDEAAGTKVLRVNSDYYNFSANFMPDDKNTWKRPGYEYSYYKDIDLTVPYDEVKKGSGQATIYVKEVATDRFTDHWTTLCIPYGISDVKYALGDVTVNAFTSVTGTDNKYVLNFTEVTAIEANTPYLIKANNAYREEYENLFTAGGSGTYAVTQEFAPAKTEVSMVGTLENVTLIFENDAPYKFFMGYKTNDRESADYWAPAFYHVVNNNRTIGANHAWFEILDPNNPLGAKIVSIVSETETGIKEIVNPDGTSYPVDNIYNVSGQLVRSNATSTEGLPKGLYIIGGRKVIVK